MIRYLGKVAAVLWKDLIAEWRTRDVLSAMLVFSLLVILIFNFAFELRRSELLSFAPGALWVAFTFAGVLGLNRSLVREVDGGGIEALLLAPVDRGAIYLAKVLGNTAFILLVELLILPIFAVIANLPLLRGGLLPVLLLGTLGFAAVGTLLAAMAVRTRTREVMLPVLLFPVAVPVIIASVRATAGILSGPGAGAPVESWLRLLAVYDVIFLVVAYLTFEFVIEE